MWVAKLCEALRRGKKLLLFKVVVCNFFFSEHVYHVAIPHQAQLSPGHGLLKVLKVEAVVVCPSTTRQLASFKFKSLKRFGSCNDILWFEVCPCTHDNGGLYFFSVGSGSETAEYVINMIKNLIQNLTKQHMVFNNAGSEGPNYSAPQHYSCPGAAPLAQVALVASMRKPSLTTATSAPIFKQRKSSTNSVTDVEMMHPRSTTFSTPQRSTSQLVKQPSVSSVDGAARTTLSNFRQASVVSVEGSMPLSRFRQGSMEAPSIPESPRNKGSVKNAERKDSGVFDEEGLTRAVSKTSVSPQGSNSSTEQLGTMDSVSNTASCPYVNYSSVSLPNSPNDTESPPISPLQIQNSLSPVQEHPTPLEDQGPPIAPPRSLISLMGRPPSQ